ncbi:MAG: pre-peptidase C-terminal domain-containing protein [Cyanobacteria bacterium P01_G01_bin.67]
MTAYTEPGNILAQARDLGIFNNSLLISEWVGSSDTRDIYSFTTHQSGELFFGIRELSNNANIQLLDSEGNIISGSYDPGTTPDLGTVKLRRGDYFVKVYSHSPGTNYNLHLSLKTSSGYNNNYYNDVDLSIISEHLGVITEEKEIVGQVGVYNVRDTYRITTHQPGDLDFSLTKLYYDANIQLLDSNENLISGSYNPGKQDEFNTYEDLAPGDYYFKIYSGSPNTYYELNFELRPDDAGDYIGQAQNVGVVLEDKHLFGWVGSTDVRDFYRFSTEQVGSLDFSLSELSNNANIQLLDSDGNLISGSYNSGTQDEFNIYENLAPGDYYFKVYSNSPGTNYKLDFEFLPNSYTIDGTNGDDFLEGIKVGDLIRGHNGNDTIIGHDGDDTLYGGAGNDSIQGYAGDNILYGQSGNDTLIGHYGNDILYGSVGDDSLHGLAGNDLLIAGEGEDKLFGHAGDDTLKGGNGQNRLYGGTGNDLLIGGKDKDSIRSDLGNDTVYGHGGQDHLSGWYGDDKIYGGDDHDQMYGDEGNDTLFGEDGNDVIYGNEGRDKLYGGNGRDYLDGKEGNDTLYGEDGNDKLRGGDSNDILIGGKGNDTLIGGLHRDIFLYNTGTAFNTDAVGIDRIEDFEDGLDRIYLDKTTFSAISSSDGFGFSNSNEFAVVNRDNQVAGSSAFIVFSRETASLFYNQNGSASGFGSGGHFATLINVNDLASEDFIIRDLTG